MRGIAEYILKTNKEYALFNNSQEYLLEFEKDLIKHLEIEHHFEYDVLFESAGLFEGCNELVKFIMNTLSNELKKNTKHKDFIFEISKFFTENLKNKSSLVETFRNPVLEKKELYTFFEKLEIKVFFCSGNSVQAAYEPKNNYKKSTDKLETCDLIFNLPKQIIFSKYSDKLNKFLTHELTHAYEDFNRQRKKNIETLSDILNNGSYKTAIKLINSENGIDQFIGKFIYFSNKQEQNAYLAELNSVLEEQFNDSLLSGNIVNELFSIIKKTDIYKNYKDVGLVVTAIENDQLDSMMHLIAKTYNDTCNTNFSTSKVKSIIISTWYKVKRKFENQIPKIVYNFIKY